MSRSLSHPRSHGRRDRVQDRLVGLGRGHNAWHRPQHLEGALDVARFDRRAMGCRDGAVLVFSVADLNWDSASVLLFSLKAVQPFS